MTNQPDCKQCGGSGYISCTGKEPQPQSIGERFWKMMRNNQFIKSRDSFTDEVIEYPPAINDMEAIIEIHGQFDKYAIEEWLLELFSLAVQQERERCKNIVDTYLVTSWAGEGEVYEQLGEISSLINNRL